jgi:nitrite reductase/ring-hydroxylating ferredoxin subunit
MGLRAEDIATSVLRGSRELTPYLAPTTGQILCAAEEIPEGRCKEIRYGEGIDAFSLLIHRSRAQVKAYVNRCPHFSLPLNVHPGEFVMLEA